MNKKDNSDNKREDNKKKKKKRERESKLPKCAKCQREPSEGRSKLITNICVYCHDYGDNKQYCEECFFPESPPPGEDGPANAKTSEENKKLQDHQDKCKNSKRVKKDIQAGYWNCQICKENLWEAKSSFSPHCSCPLGKHFYIRICDNKHSSEEIRKVMERICQRSQIKSDNQTNQKPTNQETEKLEPNQTIYYTCPHQAKMTEPNCKICLDEAEEELKKAEEEFTENGNSSVKYNSLTSSITVDFCPKCGIALKTFHGNAYRYKHRGVETNITKQIETKHCQPKQIAEHQKKLQVGSDKIKEILDSRESQKIQTQENDSFTQKQTKLQKTQNIILGGILVSLLVLIGMGIYWILRKKQIDKNKLLK